MRGALMKRDQSYAAKTWLLSEGDYEEQMLRFTNMLGSFSECLMGKDVPKDEIIKVRC